MNLLERIDKIWKHRHLQHLVPFHLLVWLGRWLVPDYRFKWPQMAWWREEEFTEYLRQFGELRQMNTDRRWMLHQLLRLTNAVAGDTAECGVYLGAGSYLICKANQASKTFERWHFAFDSFEGLSSPGDVDGAHWVKGDLAVSVEAVEQRLRAFERVSVYKGWIPTRFSEISKRRFSFVHIDVDLYEPTLDSVEFFYDRMEPGGIILCDDYGFTTCPGATKAMDEFLADKPEKMIALSAGGGFVIKGCSTSEPALP